MSSRTKRVLDFVTYVAIGLAVVGAMLWTADSGVDIEPYFLFVWLILETLVVFGYALASFKRSFGQASFWFVTSAMLAVHLVAWAVLLERGVVEKIGVLPATGAMMVELPVICVALDWMGYRPWGR